MLTRDSTHIFFHETPSGMEPEDFARWVAGSLMTYDQQVAAVVAYCVALGVNPEAALRVLDQFQPAPDQADEVEESSFGMS